MFPYVTYSRKSLEDDDKQVQSIPSQEEELKVIAAKSNFAIVESLSESKSAKAPGRLVFNAMMERVERGEIRGILCWKLDRLARNPVDGGRIIWAIKQHGLVIRTPQQAFSQAEDNLILMYIEFGMAQKYVDDLSRNTARGLKAKAEKGWLPGVARIGYLNSKVEERGNKTILRDPQRFETVRRMWDLMLAGNVSPARIQKIANEEWGFRTPQKKRSGNRPISRSTVYKIFSDPFYCGRYEYPKGSGQWYQGQHEPMVTEAEFRRVQTILRRETNPRPYREFALPLRGLIKCGDCSSSITAHFKEQVRCTGCGFKSSIKNRASCSKCQLAVSDMKNPNIRRYGYYHCTRTLDPQCRQKCISAHDLEKQVGEKLKAFGLPMELRDWGCSYIEKLHAQDLNQKALFLNENRKAYEQCALRLENLITLKTSPQNIDNSLLSDEEYQKQRAELLKQKNRLSTDFSKLETELAAKSGMAQAALNRAADIENENPNGGIMRKREILSALGLNHVLKEKELEIRPEFPFVRLPPDDKPMPRDFPPIEPDNTLAPQAYDSRLNSPNPRLEPLTNDDRTISLKAALDKMWKETELWADCIKRQSMPKLPTCRVHGPRGSFISPNQKENLP